MEYVWLTVSLLILVALLWRPFNRQVLGAIDARSARIARELDDARRLHEEARALLERYQRQLAEGERLAEEIATRAEVERQRQSERVGAELRAVTEQRTQQALDRIAQEEARAVVELRGRAANLAIRATRNLLAARMSGGEGERVMRNAIAEVTRKLA